MLEEREARRRVVEATSMGEPREMRLEEAPGAVIAEQVCAPVALPGFDTSRMDGYAVRAEDAVSGACLRVVGEQPAGLERGCQVGPGEAVRVFTGAPLPAGADAVVMQEDVEILAEGIRVRETACPGEFVLRRGEDLCAGQVILRVGDRLTPARIGLLASQGIDRVRVRTPPKVSVVTTGDEVVAPGSGLLQPGQIYNSNGPMLRAALQAFGVKEIRNFHAPDEPGRTTALLREAMEGTDVCLVAGGVSVGEHDHVKESLAGLGVSGCFWKVRVKPGKPLFFGTMGRTVVFGLPGNPVAAWVTFLLFVASALEKHLGRNPSPERPSLPVVRLRLAGEIWNDGDRPHYVRGVWEREAGAFRPVGLQQSHALHGLSRTDGLTRVEGGERLEPGKEVEVYWTGML